MKKIIKIKMIAGLLALFCLLVGTANALVINPTAGLSGTFYFGGTTGSLQTSPADGWEITVGADSLIDVSIDDCCVIGDEFALVLDGVVTPWDTSNPGAGVLFSAQVTDLFLSAGTHTFDFMLTAACCSSGAGFYSFSSVSAAPSSVPEPASLALLGLGLAGVGFSRKKKIV